MIALDAYNGRYIPQHDEKENPCATCECYDDNCALVCTELQDFLEWIGAAP